MVQYCCIKGCNNNNKNPKKAPKGISYHTFPSNSELRQKWLRAIGRSDWSPPNHAYICSAHFSADRIIRKGSRTRLKEDACPNSIFKASHLEVCKICLATDVKMYSEDSGVLKNCMKFMAGVLENEDSTEFLPRFVCYECAAHVRKFYNLVVKSVIAQETLQEMLANNFMITEDIITKQNRKQLNLQSTLSINYSTPCHVFEYEFNENDNLSCLKNKYYIDGKVSKSQEKENTMIKRDNDDNRSDDDFFKTEYLSDIESSENDMTESPIKKDNIKSDDNKNVETKYVPPVERKKVLRRKLQLQTPDELKMEKYFDIIQLSEQEQIEEWNKIHRELCFNTEALFLCEVCLKMFASKEACERHLACHDPKRGPAECRVCKRRFKNDVIAKSHANRVHGKKYQCKSCPKKFYQLFVAKKHHRLHTGQVYNCPLCEFTCKYSSTLAQHTRAQHEHTHVCARCGHGFVTAKGLERHMALTHREEELEPVTDTEFRCEQCSINFISESARRVHVLTSKQHKKSQEYFTLLSTEKRLEKYAVKKKKNKRPRVPRNDVYPSLCEHCGCEVTTRMEHWLHMLKKHPDERASYRPVHNAICTTCGKGFQSKPLLRIHELRHGKKTFACESCPRMFYDKYSLALHSHVHKPRTEHVCTVCNRAFPLRRNLERHERAAKQMFDYKYSYVHKQRTEHVCMFCKCNRASGLWRNLERHERVHTGATPYACSVCGKRYKHSDSVQLHVRTAHLKLPYPPRAPRKRKLHVDTE